MRSDQLIEIGRRYGNIADDFAVVDETTVGQLSGNILWLTKGFLRRINPEDLAELGTKNVLCADYVDDAERDELAEYIAVYIASSIRQFLHFGSARPDKIVHLVTHHADPALAGVRCQHDHFKLGYFGELANTRYLDELGDAVDFVRTNTRLPDSQWVQRLPDYSCHYAVRKQRQSDGFKPFLNGFTAAACGANIIVPLHESDARYYLGHEYPFVMQDHSAQAVLDMVAFAKQSFGGPEWKLGQLIIESVKQRSSPEFVAAELRGLVSLVE